MKRLVIFIFIIVSIFYPFEVYAGSDNFKLYKELKINGNIYKLGMGIDSKGQFGNYRQVVVLSPNGKNVFPNGESTWSHHINGYYVGNLLPGNEPEIIIWHKLFDYPPCKIVGNFYRWDKSTQKFIPYWKNITDKKYNIDQEKDIIKALLKKTEFSDCFCQLNNLKNACINQDWQQIKFLSSDDKVYQFIKNNLVFFQNVDFQIYNAGIYLARSPEFNFKINNQSMLVTAVKSKKTKGIIKISIHKNV